jgi:hypothetical protein
MGSTMEMSKAERTTLLAAADVLDAIAEREHSSSDGYLAAGALAPLQMCAGTYVSVFSRASA